MPPTPDQTFRALRAVLNPVNTVLRWFTEPPPPRPRRRVTVSADGEVEHVEILPPLSPPLRPDGPYPFLDGDAHAVDRRALGVVLGTDRRLHTSQKGGLHLLEEDGEGAGSYVGWLPDGTGHGVPPDTGTALCGAVPEFLWLGEFLGSSVERSVQRCEACVALTQRHWPSAG